MYKILNVISWRFLQIGCLTLHAIFNALAMNWRCIVKLFHGWPCFTRMAVAFAPKASREVSKARAPADSRRRAADRPIEPTNEWYAIAKIVGLKLCEAIIGFHQLRRTLAGAVIRSERGSAQRRALWNDVQAWPSTRIQERMAYRADLIRLEFNVRSS
jgi:hypothetical protein